MANMVTNNDDVSTKKSTQGQLVLKTMSGLGG